jgi:D-alanyl-lipoteichoic acid acyltransferase DltB (MBOAT superfamily)
MLFNSVDFAVFLPLVFILYWTVFNRSIRLQNGFLLVASMVFYGWWDWRYLGLVFFNAAIDFFVGRRLQQSENNRTRKAYLALSMVANLGMLGFFKYYNFFVGSFNDAFTLLGQPLEMRTLSLVLPVGISFYTFQTMSYTIDIYRRQLSATNDPISFAAYVLFFPQLVAGPIERATRFLPQFFTARKFNIDQARDGVRQILWGLFKKVVIADNCAEYVNIVYADPSAMSGATLALGTLFFAFQIYGDFSGYSDIAIGSGRLLGFNLMRNFNYPYFARDIAEFWKRWHISLSTWFRDYLYIPLGGSRGSKAMFVRNSMIVFTVSGFWHGASWNFIIWGVLNGLYFIPIALFGDRKKNSKEIAVGKALPSLFEFRGMLTTFGLTCLAWVAFRATDLSDTMTVYQKIFSPTLFETPFMHSKKAIAICLLSVGVMFLLEWYNRNHQYGLEFNGRVKRPLRILVYYGVIALIVAFAPMSEGEFIYFQF